MNTKKRICIFAFLKQLNWLTVGLAILFTVSLVSVSAWFYYERWIAIIAKIEAPNNIYINAANDEDIMYLDLTGIEVEENIANGIFYKDFAFTISGDNLSTYRIQLAYTTNNQFRYEIYHAKKTAGDHEVQYYSEKDGLLYYTFDGNFNGVVQDAKISMTPLNEKKVDGERLGALSEDQEDVRDLYSLTYGNSGTDYSYVHKYAVPIYEQSTYEITFQPDENNEFHHPYIIRVIWGENATNNRETDIIYISAAHGKSALQE